MRNGAASRRNGSVITRKITSRTPWTATPMMRNGSNNSQTNGYATNASSARGQHRTKRMHHSRNANMADTSSCLDDGTLQGIEKFHVEPDPADLAISACVILDS